LKLKNNAPEKQIVLELFKVHLCLRTGVVQRGVMDGGRRGHPLPALILVIAEPIAAVRPCPFGHKSISPLGREATLPGRRETRGILPLSLHNTFMKNAWREGVKFGLGLMRPRYGISSPVLHFSSSASAGMSLHHPPSRDDREPFSRPRRSRLRQPKPFIDDSSHLDDAVAQALVDALFEANQTQTIINSNCNLTRRNGSLRLGVLLRIFLTRRAAKS
jgi:hypothetical protein